MWVALFAPLDVNLSTSFSETRQAWSFLSCSFFVQLPPSNVAKLTTLEGGSCTVPETVVTVLCTPDNGCDWHPKHIELTRRTKNRLFCVASRWTVTNIQFYRLLQRGQSWPHWREVAAQKNMNSTGGCSYSFVDSWWWVLLTPETCRVNLQNNK